MMSARTGNWLRTIGVAALALSLAALLNGCVSAARARAEAREAYLAGERDAMLRMQQPAQQSVTFVGPVRNHVIEWTDGLTLSQGILKAVYTAQKDPTLIVIHRGGQDISVMPDQLLAGKDVKLQPNDVVEIH